LSYSNKFAVTARNGKGKKWAGHFPGRGGLFSGVEKWISGLLHPRRGSPAKEPLNTPKNSSFFISGVLGESHLDLNFKIPARQQYRAMQVPTHNTAFAADKGQGLPLRGRGQEQERGIKKNISHRRSNKQNCERPTGNYDSAAPTKTAQASQTLNNGVVEHARSTKHFPHRRSNKKLREPNRKLRQRSSNKKTAQAPKR
jgi:hypothetical protein